VSQDRNDIIDDLITRCLAGEASGDEQRQLTTWIERSEENKQHYLHMSQSLELAGQYFSNSGNELSVDVEQEWNRFVREINRTKKGREVAMGQAKKPTVGWLKIAAALLVLVASGLLIRYFISQNTIITYKTTANTLTVNLPDGSRVELNRNSELSYAPSFDDQRREVILKGEAFFDVSHNPQKPFIIQVDEARVEVLGTSFNIRGANENNNVEVTVQTGTVKLSGPDKTGTVKLKAGEKGIYSRESGSTVQQTNDDVNFLAWKTQKIIFNNASLQTVAATLSHVYGKAIVITTSVPASCSVTVTFDHQTLEAVLNVLKDTLNLTYREMVNQIEITQVGC